MTQLSSSHSQFGVKNAALSQFMSKVYTWMTLGILLSGLVAFIINSHAGLQAAILSNPVVFNTLLIAQLICVLTFVFIQQPRDR